MKQKISENKRLSDHYIYLKRENTLAILYSNKNLMAKNLFFYSKNGPNPPRHSGEKGFTSKKIRKSSLPQAFPLPFAGLHCRTLRVYLFSS